MAKKIEPAIGKKSTKPINPIVKRKRNPQSPPNNFEATPLDPDDEFFEPDRGHSENGQSGKKNFDDLDPITEPSRSIFKHNKEGGKFDGTFGEFSDNVMFNPPEPQMGFDTEWVRFLNQLSADETTKSMADYIRIAPLTRRAKYKLMIYIKTLLDREFTMSNILDQNDMASLNLDKLLIDADLTLGLTRFDLSPEFQHIVNLVRIKFGIKSRRSLFGFERINVNTQRSVSENTDTQSGGGMEVRKSIQGRIKDLFKGD